MAKGSSPKRRLDAELVRRKIARSREHAVELIKDGRVTVNGMAATKPATAVTGDVSIRVSEDADDANWASRGAHKLLGALAAFEPEGLTLEGRRVIDAGASTGGFTDCLVSRGAKTVYAVDVGYGQLVGRLRQDKHVVNLEKTNISDEKLLSLSPTPTLGTVDLSYLSLRKGVPFFRDILHGRGELICLVKPLFETEDMEARRTGILSQSVYAPLLEQLISDLESQENTYCENVTNSAVTGNAGTIEFFLHLRLGARQREMPQNAVEAAVARAIRLEKFRK